LLTEAAYAAFFMPLFGECCINDKELKFTSITPGGIIYENHQDAAL
jgi:hypothetical protein